MFLIVTQIKPLYNSLNYFCSPLTKNIFANANSCAYSNFSLDIFDAGYKSMNKWNYSENQKTLE